VGRYGLELMFDVIVCGAGPAGAIAATVLARGGARVLMLDRARFPRAKLCGDTINPGAVAILRRLDLLPRVEAQALDVHGMIVTGERGVSVRCEYGDGVRGLAIARRELDATLAESAASAGARFEDGVLVRGALVDSSDGHARVRGVVIAGRDGRDVRVPAPLVIGADGRRSRLAISLGLARQPARPRRWAAGAYFEGVAGMSPLGEMHVRRGQYIGLASVPGGTTNVCVVVGSTPALRDPAALIDDAIAADWLLRPRFAEARRISVPAVIGPLALDASAAGMPGLLLAGDASGFIDPMTGDGLRFAMRGGELAAAAALAALSGMARPHERLAHARRREFAGKWRFNRALRQVVDHPASVNAATLAAQAAPWILRRTIAFAGDVSR
jgi:geranylgeranyl reductase family protein